MSVIRFVKRDSPTDAPASAFRRGPSARLWYWTAGSGLALVALATMHIIAQHFIVHQTGGLRTYAEVLSYIANPIIFVLETGFVLAVTVHAMLGIRGILHDLDLRAKTKQRVDVALWALGTLTVAYSLVLLITLASRAP